MNAETLTTCSLHKTKLEDSLKKRKLFQTGNRKQTGVEESEKGLQISKCPTDAIENGNQT
jgi:hypothetical protein